MDGEDAGFCPLFAGPPIPPAAGWVNHVVTHRDYAAKAIALRLVRRPVRVETGGNGLQVGKISGQRAADTAFPELQESADLSLGLAGTRVAHLAPLPACVDPSVFDEPAAPEQQQP